MNKDIGKDGNGIALFRHTLDVRQSLEQCCALSRKLHLCLFPACQLPAGIHGSLKIIPPKPISRLKSVNPYGLKIRQQASEKTEKISSPAYAVAAPHLPQMLHPVPSVRQRGKRHA